ncbi:hypothetical protein AAG906_030234 [Vitis piasezkii]
MGSGHNQIPMFPWDSDKTVFITNDDVYCNNVMSFGYSDVRAISWDNYGDTVRMGSKGALARGVIMNINGLLYLGLLVIPGVTIFAVQVKEA